MTTKLPRCRAAFTLVELLVVVGLIALLAGVIGVAMKGGDSSTALKGAQSTVFSLVASARGQAILNQGTARLLIYADATDTTGKNLHYMAVAYTSDSSPTASSTWTFAGAGFALPQGVYVIPPTGMSLTSGTSAYATKTLSQLGGPVSMTVSGTVLSNVYYVEFTQLGTPTSFSGNYGTIALSTATPNPTNPAVPQFNNPANVRGLLIRKLGSSTLLNSTSDF